MEFGSESSFKLALTSRSLLKIRMYPFLFAIRELSSTFARLCHLVDSSSSDMESDMKNLEIEIQKLDEIAASSKVLKNKANYLMNELELFDAAFLKK